MPTGVRSRADLTAESLSEESPQVSVCESRPGTSVFIESGNTDGWISTDTVVSVTR